MNREEREIFLRGLGLGFSLGVCYAAITALIIL